MDDDRQDELVLDLAIEYAKTNGEWPTLEPIHEHIHQVLHLRANVKESARRLAPLGYVGGGYTTLRDTFVPPLAMIARSAEGRRLLEYVVEFVKLACEKYESSVGQPDLASREVEASLGMDAGAARAVRLITRWVPSVTDGGHSDADGWSVKVDPEVMQWSDLQDVEDLLSRVDEISRQGHEHLGKLTEAQRYMSGGLSEDRANGGSSESADMHKIRLDPEQEELLAQMVEAQRSLPRKQRRHFILSEMLDSTDLVHPAPGRIELTKSDMDALEMQGLVYLAAIGGHGSPNYDITPEGYAYYEALRTRRGRPLLEVEEEVTRRFIEGEEFRRYHPGAWTKWTQAADKLWSQGWEKELTNIGHLCRETIQEFASELIARFQPPDAPPDRNRDIARIKALLEQQKGQLPTRDSKLLDANATYLDSLLDYWRAVSGLIQRQEHGLADEEASLTWGDARRVVFQTVLVMYEIDASLRR